MAQTRYEPVIGLEVHAQLLTESKVFSPDSAAFGSPPNEHVDPVSLGHPGTLPVLNTRAIEYIVRMGLATHCEIAPRSVFARKHYFYPDLPKGYQISQYETPICANGYLDIELESTESGTGTKRIGITRIHLEEDAGKSLHDQDPYNTCVDFNRCGVSLIEIVSEPDLRSPREAFLYMQKIRQIVRYLGICDGNMEEGSLRCDANVSVRPVGQQTLGTKAEIKNMNSFRNVERAIEYEIERQIAILESGGQVVQETRLWDANRSETRPMRSKEEAHDYRYFPDPDLVPVTISEERLAEIRNQLTAMPEVRRVRLVGQLGLPEYDAHLLIEDRATADYFDQCLARLAEIDPDGERSVQAKAISNQIMSGVLRVLNESDHSVEQFPIGPERLARLTRMRIQNQISSTAAQELFNTMLEDQRNPEEIAASTNMLQVSDSSAILPVIEKVVGESQKQVEQYLGGKTTVIGYFIGQVMKQFPGSPDPALVKTLVQEKLDSMRN